MTTAFRPSAPTVPGTTDELLDGRYRLVARLGSGGAADVWRAHDTRLERPVAVKIFRPGTTDPARERAEVEFMAACSHSGLVTVFDAGTLDSRFEAPRSYLVMELVDGPTLRERLRSAPLPPAAVAALGTQVAAALAYVHAQGVVHRDVKPANLLIAEGADESRGTVKLADFGVARMLGSEPLTEAGTTVGTANYVSPEQIRGAEVGPASDVYSLGLVLIEALTGRMVYPGRGLEAALARLERRPAIPAGIGPGLTGLLEAMTADDPSARPTAAAVARRLAESGFPDDVVTAAFVAVPASVVAPSPQHPVAAVTRDAGPGRRRPGRGVVLVGAATVAALLGGAGLAVASSLGSSAPAPAPAATARHSDPAPVAHRPVAQAPSGPASTPAAAATTPAGAAAQQAQQLTLPATRAPAVRHAAPKPARHHSKPGKPGKHGGGDSQGD